MHADMSLGKRLKPEFTPQYPSVGANVRALIWLNAGASCPAHRDMRERSWCCSGNVPRSDPSLRTAAAYLAVLHGGESWNISLIKSDTFGADTESQEEHQNREVHFQLRFPPGVPARPPFNYSHESIISLNIFRSASKCAGSPKPSRPSEPPRW